MADAAGSASRDIREEAAAKRRPADDGGVDTVRVPSADETAESVRRAQRALHELKQRQTMDARHAENEGRDEASRRHTEQLQQETSRYARTGSANWQHGPESLALDAPV